MSDVLNEQLRPVQTLGKSMFDNSQPVIASDILKNINTILYFLKSENQRIYSRNMSHTKRKFSRRKCSESLDIPLLIL